MINRIELHVSKRDDQVDDQLARIEKNMTQAFNKLRVDSENQIQKTEIRLEESNKEIRRQMEVYRDKLQNIDETEVIKKWVNNYVEYKITDCQLRIDKCNSNIKEAIE